MYSAETESSSTLRGAAAGAIGGIVGSAAMVLFNHVLAGPDLAEQISATITSNGESDAKPNDSDGTIADEPASRKAASAAAEASPGEPLDERKNISPARSFTTASALPPELSTARSRRRHPR